ncbi:DUF1993 family protein [Methylobacterium sp. SyP6R]|uniref:DUF1993 family protein n=1 Tax=Methylobacterium sp. SyP6R TaxID=2718876 RepID=UPI003FA5513C
MLRALSGWLDKARAHHGAEADGLMSRRLAPDRFPLSSQVRFACLQAQEATTGSGASPCRRPSTTWLARDGRRASGRAPCRRRKPASPRRLPGSTPSRRRRSMPVRIRPRRSNFPA